MGEELADLIEIVRTLSSNINFKSITYLLELEGASPARLLSQGEEEQAVIREVVVQELKVAT